jgi:hypothetical protein
VSATGAGLESVSIHAPVKEATRFKRAYTASSIIVSIHAPVKEATGRR